MNKKQVLTVAIATTMLTTGLALTATNAEEPTASSLDTNRPSHEEMHQRRDAVREAIEANDYQAWVEAMANHPKAEEFVNEETFQVLVQAHELMEAGDREGAKSLFEEAGIHPRGIKGHHGPKSESFQAIRKAVEANDYQAWSEAMANHPKAEEFVNEETFQVLVQAHELMEAGDRDAAKALLEEAGIPGPRKFRR